MDTTKPSFWVRHEFLILRLHSLSGLIPVGAYMVVHLLTNATVLESPSLYQRNVYLIHGLPVLTFIEWTFIFLPLIYHSVVGVVIVRGGLPNNGTYNQSSNIRYTLQRVTGMIAFFFIFWHVFHMHGWFPFETWVNNVAEPLRGHEFRPFNAASSLRYAMRGVVVPVFYLVGVLASVFHLANGIWTMGITWGVWTSLPAQRRASWVCSFFGIALAAVSVAAMVGATTVPMEQALESEEKQYQSRLAADEIDPEQAHHKRWSDEELQRVQEFIDLPGTRDRQSQNSPAGTVETATP